MRAVVQDRYGPPEVLRVVEVERPVPADHQVLVRIHSATMSRTDSGLRTGQPFMARFFTGLLQPNRILGVEFGGGGGGARRGRNGVQGG